MAPSSVELLPHLVFIFSVLFFFPIPAQQQEDTKSSSSIFLMLPIIKDSESISYYTTVKLGTPPVKVNLTIDIGSQTNWLHPGLSHYNDNNSSTKTPFPCCSCPDHPHENDGAITGTGSNINPSCLYENGGCIINMCSAYIPCSESDVDHYVHLIRDIITLYQYHQLSSSSRSRLPTFSFGLIELKEPLIMPGVLSLSRSPLSLNNQIADYYKTPRKFTLCLPSSSSSNSNGAVFFGDLPPTKINFISRIMLPIPILTVNFTVPKYRYGDINLEYMIKIKSIKISGTRVPFNSSLLDFGHIPSGESFDGGSKLTTIASYSQLITAIYRPFVDLFIAKAEAMNMTRVHDDSQFFPFRPCYNSSSIRYDPKTGGPQVPIIDLMFERFSSNVLRKNKRVRWRFYGSNSMKTVSIDVVCLAFVENTNKVSGIPMASVMIGGKQMEDNLIEFDQDKLMIRVNGFPLGKYGTSCSKFVRDLDN